MIRTLTAAIAVSLLATTAYAADLGTRKPSPVPVASTSCKETEKSALPTDVFGFTTGSDVSDVGAIGPSVEYDGNFKGGGFKPGSYSGHLLKAQVSTAFVPCWEIGPYILGQTTSGSNRGIPGEIKFNAFGGGVENKYKILGRDTHGIGLTLDADFNYQGFNQKDQTVVPNLGWSGGQANASYRIFVDKELIAGKLFGAINAVWDQTWTQRPSFLAPGNSSDYVRGSNLTFSGALSYQLLDGLFVGGEARYVRTHNGSLFNQFTGDAVFVGPTFFWQATKQVALTGAWGIQVAGNTKFAANAVVAPNLRASDLNLVTQNQHIAKLKLVFSF